METSEQQPMSAVDVARDLAELTRPAPTAAERSDALWAMTSAERVAAMHAGEAVRGDGICVAGDQTLLSMTIMKRVIE